MSIELSALLGSGGGGFKNKFTSAVSGSFTLPATKNSCFVLITGGGGGGWGGDGSGANSIASGGSGAGSVGVLFTFEFGQEFNFVIGAAGTGGVGATNTQPSATLPTNGGDSILYLGATAVRPLLIAGGGLRGSSVSATSNPNTVYSCTTGGIMIRGGRVLGNSYAEPIQFYIGGTAFATSISAAQVAANGASTGGAGGLGGGSSWYGIGGNGGEGRTGTGENGFDAPSTNYGAGGGGAGRGTTLGGNGGNGASGFIEIWY